MGFQRFDDRRMIIDVLLAMHAEGYGIEDIDVRMSAIAPVDLDLLWDCVHQLSSAQAVDSWTFEQARAA